MPEVVCERCTRLCGEGVGQDHNLCLFCAVQPQLERLWAIGSHNETLWAAIRPELERLLQGLQDLIAHSTVVRCLGSLPVSGTSRLPEAWEVGDPEEALEVLEEGEERESRSRSRSRTRSSSTGRAAAGAAVGSGCGARGSRTPPVAAAAAAEVAEAVQQPSSRDAPPDGLDWALGV